MTTAANSEREVWRNFRRAQGGAMVRRVRENSPAHTGIMLSALLPFLLVIFTDSVVWWGLAPDSIFPVPLLSLFLVSLLFLPLNGWFAHTLLFEWTPRDQERPRWLRATRFAVASLFPFGGLAILPFWRELLSRNPFWIKPQNDLPVRFTLRGSAVEAPRRQPLKHIRRFEILGIPLSMGSTFPFLVGGLMAANPHGALGRLGGIVFNLTLHIAFFLGFGRMIRRFSYLSAGSPWARLLPVSRWALLFPFPVYAVGLLFIAYAIFGPARDTWIGTLYSQRSEALRFPLWRQVGREVRPTLRGFSWVDLSRRPPSIDPLREGRVASRCEALARLTVLFLPPEAGLLTWFVLRTNHWQLREPTLANLLIVAAGLAFGSFVLQILPAAAERLNWKSGMVLSPYLRSGALLLPTAGCLLGIIGGVGAARGDIRFVSSIRELFALFLSLVGLVSALRGSITKRPFLGYFMTWISLYVAIAVLAPVLKIAPHGLADRAVILVLLVPLLNLIAGATLLPALLRPFTWRLIFDPRRPAALRTALAINTLTAVLPLGGLAAPFWIWTRHKLWPRYLHEDPDR